MLLICDTFEQCFIIITREENACEAAGWKDNWAVFDKLNT